AGFQLRYDGSRVVQQPQRVVFVSTLAVLRDGRRVGELIPSLNMYPSSTDLIGTPSISKGTPRNGFRDLYASLQSLAKKGVTASFRLFSNPGVLWLWVGGAVMVLGGVVALWPSRRRRPAAEPEAPAAEAVREPVEAGA